MSGRTVDAVAHGERPRRAPGKRNRASCRPRDEGISGRAPREGSRPARRRRGRPGHWSVRPRRRRGHSRRWDEREGERDRAEEQQRQRGPHEGHARYRPIVQPAPPRQTRTRGARRPPLPIPLINSRHPPSSSSSSHTVDIRRHAEYGQGLHYRSRGKPRERPGIAHSAWISSIVVARTAPPWAQYHDA